MPYVDVYAQTRDVDGSYFLSRRSVAKAEPATLYPSPFTRYASPVTLTPRSPLRAPKQALFRAKKPFAPRIV
jgi:hypothetical protein